MSNPIKHLDLVEDTIPTPRGEMTRYRMRYSLEGGGSSKQFRFSNKSAMYSKAHAIATAEDYARLLKLDIKHINIVEG